MGIEADIQALNTNVTKLISLLANGVPQAPPAGDTSPEKQPGAPDPFAGAGGSTPGASTPAEPQKRGRGRPAKNETPAPQPTSPAPTVQSANDFLSLSPSVPTAPPVTIEAVRAALAVYKAKNDMPKALELFKQASGVDTLARLTPDKFNTVFEAALPARKFTHDDIRAVLVKAQERTGGVGGMKALKDHGGVEQLGLLAEDKFVAVINAADTAQ